MNKITVKSFPGEKKHVGIKKKNDKCEEVVIRVERKSTNNDDLRIMARGRCSMAMIQVSNIKILKGIAVAIHAFLDAINDKRLYDSGHGHVFGVQHKIKIPIKR